MNTEISTASQCYGLYDDNKIIGFCAMIHQPHPKRTNLKRIHRLVILPDYQGIGLGVKFLNFVAQIFHEQGYAVSIVTSAKNMIYGLNKNAKWVCMRKGRGALPKRDYKNLKQSNRANVVTCTFKYRN